jgi:methyl-accepting chemotaxis protein
MLKEISVKNKIITLSVGLVLTLGLIASFLVHSMMEEDRKLLITSFQSYADNLENSISAQFFERYGDVQAFALNPVLIEKDKNSIQEALNNYIKLYGIYDLIIFVDQNGKFISSSNVDVNGKQLATEKFININFSTDSWFQAASNEKFTADKERNLDGTFFEGPYHDKIVETAYGEAEKSWGTSFSAPVKDKAGKIIGYLSARANMKWVENEYVQIYKSMASTGHIHSEMALIDHAGKFIVEHTPEEGSDLNTVKRDWEVIAKKGIPEEHPDLWEYMEKLDNGTKLTYDEDLGFNQVASFSKLNSSKFVPSIGWSVVVMESEVELFGNANRMERNFLIVFFTIALISVMISVYLSTKIAGNLNLTALELQGLTHEVSTSAYELTSLSGSLQTDIGSQVSAVQQTVATLDLVNEMVKKNTDSANYSQADAEHAVKQTVVGQEIVEKMMNAIRQIENSNQDFVKENEMSNIEIAKIVTLIEDVNSKTKIINDIVFQTKLLSFNASVEAARAGESGKGFAVVAEEVGKLAEMSGSAASEISALLNSSNQQVKDIISTSTRRQSDLLEKSTKIIGEGIEISNSCRGAFDQILDSIEQVKQRTVEISLATREQSSGVFEMTKAVQAIDQMAQRNSQSATICASTATKLNEGADQMLSVIEKFLKFVNGVKKVSKS